MTTPTVDVEHRYAELISKYPFLFVADGELRCRCGKIFNPARVSDAAQINRHLERDRHVIWASEQGPQDVEEISEDHTSDHDSMYEQPVDNCPDMEASTPPPRVVVMPAEKKKTVREQWEPVPPWVEPLAEVRGAFSRTRVRLRQELRDCRCSDLCKFPHTLRGCILCTVILLWIFLTVVGVLSTVTYFEDHHATPEINDAVAAYDADMSVLNHVAAGSSVKTITANQVIDQQALRSRVVTRELTGWTTGLTTKWIGGVTVKTDGLVNFTEPSNPADRSTMVVSLLHTEGRDLNFTVPFPEPWLLLTAYKDRFRPGGCDGWCRGYGGHETGGAIVEHCSEESDGDHGTETWCDCWCKYRRYITTACYVVEDDGWGRSTTLRLRKEKPTCGPPYTLEAGHSYHSRYPVSIEVELRASNDPLLVALFVTDGTMRLSGRRAWLLQAILCLIFGGSTFGCIMFLIAGCFDLFPRPFDCWNWERTSICSC